MPPLNPPTGDGRSASDAVERHACGAPAHEPSSDRAPRRPDERGYWRSLGEFTDSAEFNAAVDREFGTAADDDLSPDERRHFMKIMGASFALAGLTFAGCRRLPEQKIVPYASRPANRTPGDTVQYATSHEIGGVGRGLVATSFDGRPIKIDGNALHPGSLGASDSYAQASVLELYDQDRSREIYAGDEVSGWDAFSAAATERFGTIRGDQGRGLAVIAEATNSPSLRAEKARFMAAFPQARWVEWEPVNGDPERAGTAIAFGAPHRAQVRFDDPDAEARASVIVSLDSDFLLEHPDRVRHMREFARSRRVDNPDPAGQQLSRLYVFESGLSTTGMRADERSAVRSTDVAAVAAMLADAIGVSAGSDRFASAPSAKALDADVSKVVAAAARDLMAARGASVVVAGEGQPPAVHALAALMNQQLGNIGRTVVYTRDADPDRPGCAEAIRDLAAAMKSGSVETLLILGGNPVYTAPADVSFAAALATVPFSVHLGYYRDETARACTWHVPTPHYLETWGDTRGWDGTMAVQQPLIEPMIDPGQGGRSPMEILAILSGDDVVDGYDLVRRTFATMTDTDGDEMDRRWRTYLHDGVLTGSGWSSETPTIDAGRVSAALGALAETYASVTPDALEVTFRPDATVFDGRYSNNGWLQELPEPMTRLTWDNAAVMSPATAESLGLEDGDMITLAVDGRQLDIAAWRLPGHADGSISLSLGYGRGPDAGSIADKAGFDTYLLRGSDAMTVAIGATATATGEWYKLVDVQDRGAGNTVAEKGIQDRLPTLVREGTLDEYHEHPDFAKHRSHVAHRLSLWEESNLDGAEHAWAMSIDLNACTGCSACVVACQAENNIPIVGKEQVRRGREMHWIRIDRYFRGADPKKPDAVSVIPVACMHCENAPCEQVCPVAATVHDSGGLNVMVYNRCIGTRYCSNNCPYKVRRFNYFDWHRKLPTREDDWIQTDAEYYVRNGPNEWKRMQFNPEVTVRMRGVMEKCTFCTQRITQEKIKAKNAWAEAGGRQSGVSNYSIPDGAIVPACAEACPAEAIVFGDLMDPESRVARLHKSDLSYGMLEELNTKPRLKYLAQVRNPGIMRPSRDGGHGHGHGHGDDHGHDHGDDHGQGTDGGHAPSDGHDTEQGEHS